MYKFNIRNNNSIKNENLDILGDYSSGVDIEIIRDFTLKLKKYRVYMMLSEGVFFNSDRVDLGGGSYNDHYHIFLKYEGKDYELANIKLNVKFVSGYYDNYDYISITRRDNSTAYKSRPSGKEEETKFKIYSADCEIKNDNNEKLLEDELSRLMGIMDGLYIETGTLQDWASSGISMRVICSNKTRKICWRKNKFSNQDYDTSDDISSEMLKVYSDKGWSLEYFREKLKCRVCGSPPKELVPATRVC